MTTRKFSLAALPAILALAVPAFIAAPTQASIFHHHPGATGVAAAVVAHHMAKHHGHGFMHRHPMATAVGAGMLAHHMAKHHMR